MDNKHTYLSSLIHPITNPRLRAVLIKDLLSGRPRSYLPSPNAVVLDEEQGKLYTWTGERWDDFYPDQFTDYDGPNPHVKHIGETVTDIVNKPKKRTIEIRYTDHTDSYFIVHCALIGDVVTYNGAEYIYTGENDGWQVFNETSQPNNKEEKNMSKHNIFENEEVRLTYIGKTTTAICEYSTAERLYVEGCWISSVPGYMVMFKGRLYTYAPDGKWHDLTATNVKTARTTPTNYSSIPYGYLFIDKVVFNAPATIVFWKDGSKTIVKCGENESFDPEKGLVMAIAKKAFGNQGNYYNRIKKWLPEPKEDDSDEYLTMTERLNKIFGDPKIADAKKKLAAVQELICDMTFNGATKAELVRAIRFSKDLIDFSKGADIDIAESVTKNGIEELEAKYQPK